MRRSAPAGPPPAAVRSAVRSRDGVYWKRIPDLGRTGDELTPFPVTAPGRAPGGAGPRLEHDLTLTTTWPVRVPGYLSPRNNVLPTEGLRYAVSIDDGPPQVVDTGGLRPSCLGLPESFRAGD